MTIDDTLRRDLHKSKAKTVDGERVKGAAYDTDLDRHLVSSSKQVLLKHVDFQPAERDISFRLQNLRGKYVPLNPAKPNSGSEGYKQTQRSSSIGKMSAQGDGPKSDGIPPPKQILYPSTKVQLDWQKCHRVGGGLINMGNTCFLNSTLQCLTYTAPLANYLLSQQHKEECREYGFCILCDLCTHFQRAFQHHSQAIRPMNMIHKLKSIAKHMHIGRQEDAHEFLRYVIEAMQRSCLSGYDKLDRYSKETSPVHQIFGGYYRSRVTCGVCQSKSDTFDPFLDISLDIKHAPSVTKALERLIRSEILDGDNAYQCKRCNKKVQAQKRFTVHRSPNILTLCLKRFDFNRFSMGKINKEVSYSEFLNLRPYMSENKGPPIYFQLYAVLKHEGASCNSGHYYCYVRAPNQSWYCMNDSYVSQASLGRVLNQNAYLLFYARKPHKGNVNGSNQGQTEHINKQMPKTATSPNFLNKTSNPHKGPLGTPIARPKPSMPTLHSPVTPKSVTPKPVTPKPVAPKPVTPKPKIIAEPEKKPQTFTPAARHTMVPLPANRDKLSFTISSNNKGVGGVLQSLQAGQFSSSENTKNSSPENKTNSLGPKRTDPATKLTVEAGKPLLKSKKGVDVLSKKAKIQQGLIRPKPKQSDESVKGSVVTKKEGVLPKLGKSSSLVPYGEDDSSRSSSDSETNYDAVVERLSKGTIKDVGASTSSGSEDKKELTGDANMKPPESLKPSWENGKKSALASSTNLTTIRKSESPLKLTITTNGNAQRMKSTTPWRVTDSDQQVSPSVASDSSIHSNMSTNSTSEWSVNDKKDTQPLVDSIKKEAAHVGWSVTPSPSKNGTLKFWQDGKEEIKNGVCAKPTVSGFKEEADMIVNEVKSRTSSGNSLKEEKCDVTEHLSKQLNCQQHNEERTKESVSVCRTDSEKRKMIVPENSASERKSLQLNQYSNATVSESNMQNTTNKQNGTKQLDDGHSSNSKTNGKGKVTAEFGSDDSEGEDSGEKKDKHKESDSDDSAKKKKKKKKKKHLQDDGDEKQHLESTDQTETHQINAKPSDEEKTKDVPVTDAFRKYRGHSKSRAYRSDSDSDHSDAHFRMKKNGQPLLPHHDRYGDRHRHHDRYFSPDSDYDDDSSPIQHHRDHRRKRKYRDHDAYNERPFQRQDAPEEQWYGAPYGGKRKRMMNGYGDSWIRRDNSFPKRHRQDGYSQNWDHHIRDGFPRRPQGDGPSKMSQSWDGSRRPVSGDVMDYLNKSSLKGYGSSVQSWDGGRSGIDEEVDRDVKMGKRRDKWNEDYDRGKVKKTKQRYDSFDRYSSHYNAFQAVQNDRNKGSFRGDRHGYKPYHVKKSSSWHGGRPR